MEHKIRKATIEDCQVCNEPPNCGTKPLPCNIEVILGERIAVGDIVEMSGIRGIVEYYHKLPTMSDDKCQVKFSDKETVQTVWSKSLTLIRKGEHHVFEEVAFSKVSTQVYPYMDNPEEYRKLSDNGKKYQMILKEINGN